VESLAARFAKVLSCRIAVRLLLRE
jgi:hypothetical protein